MESSSRKVDYSFRAYAPEDQQGCLEVFDSNIPEFFSVEERVDFIGFLGRLPGRYGVVVDSSGRIVGCGGVAKSRTNERGANLTWGMIHRALHGRGIGRILTEKRIEWIQSLPDVDVVAIDTSHLTEGFYEKFGFRTVKRIPNGYREGLHRCDMEWNLRPGRQV